MPRVAEKRRANEAEALPNEAVDRYDALWAGAKQDETSLTYPDLLRSLRVEQRLAADNRTKECATTTTER